MGTTIENDGAENLLRDSAPTPSRHLGSATTPDATFTWEGTLKDPDLEEQFRRTHWTKGFDTVRLTLIFAAVATPAASIVDFITLDDVSTILTLLVLRIFAVVACLLPLYIYRNPGNAKRFEDAIIGAEAALFLILAATTYFDSQGYVVSMTGTVAFIFAVYAFLPLRLAYIAPVSIAGSSAQIVILSYSDAINLHEWIMIALILIAANGLGVMAARALSELRRREFLQTKELEDSRDQLQQAETVYRTLLETSDAHAELFTPEGTRIAMNKWVSKARGVNEEDLIGKSIYEGLDDISAATYRDTVARALQARRAFRFNYDENGKSFESIVQPILNEIGEVTAVSVHTFDRTQTRRREAALKHAQVEALSAQRLAERAQHAAEAANMSKTRFLANMSHELRTPLNAIIGFSEIIKTGMFGEVNPKYAEYAEDIHNSGAYLLALISDILDLAKIESGHSDLKEINFILDDVIEDALRIIEPQARNNGIYSIEKGFIEPPLEICADERAIKQVLINLLTNAVRYGASGGRLAVSSKLDGEGISIRVTDWGPGIPEEDLERIMEPFEQIEMRTDSGGVGLGLSLAKHLVESHDGSLTIESTVGERTSVIMRLPLSRVRSPMGARHVN